MSLFTSPQTNQKIASTQEFLPIKEIKNGIIVLKDGNLRTVVMVKSSGFDLKSEAEQEAIIASFENFINSLNYPLQILMRSKKVDLTGYLESLKKRAKEETNELLADQINNYINFVSGLAEDYNIMSKSFYIIIPHNIGTAKVEKVNFWKNIFGPPKNTINKSNFEQEKLALFEKTDIIVNELNNMGLRAIQLNTKELIELFYNIYNPQTSQQEKIINIDDMTVPMITKKNK